MASPKTCIFIGRPGSGKGTQSQRLIEKLKMVEPVSSTVYIETGSIFRKFMEGEGYTQGLAKKTMEQGGRHPEFLAVWNWGTALVEQLTGIEHLVFDGAPRALSEAQILDTAMKYYQRSRPAVAFLNVGLEWSTTRLKARGRADDNDEDIANRLSWFDRDVGPAIDYYRHNPDYNFLDINGEQAVDEVSRDIFQGLGI